MKMLLLALLCALTYAQTEKLRGFKDVYRDVWCADEKPIRDSKGKEPSLDIKTCKERCHANPDCKYMFFGDAAFAGKSRCALFETCEKRSDYDAGKTTIYERLIRFGKREKGRCVMANGDEPKAGIKKREKRSEDRMDCFHWCEKQNKISGCQFVFNKKGKECYAHTKSVSRGNGQNNAFCWIRGFSYEETGEGWCTANGERIGIMAKWEDAKVEKDKSALKCKRKCDLDPGCSGYMTRDGDKCQLLPGITGGKKSNRITGFDKKQKHENFCWKKIFDRCPKGYHGIIESMDGSDRQWAKPKSRPARSIQDCADVCQDRESCTGFEFAERGPEKGSCATFTEKKDNVKKKDDRLSMKSKWRSCLRRPSSEGKSANGEMDEDSENGDSDLKENCEVIGKKKCENWKKGYMKSFEETNTERCSAKCEKTDGCKLGVTIGTMCRLFESKKECGKLLPNDKGEMFKCKEKDSDAGTSDAAFSLHTLFQARKNEFWMTMSCIFLLAVIFCVISYSRYKAESIDELAPLLVENGGSPI